MAKKGFRSYFLEGLRANILSFSLITNFKDSTFACARANSLTFEADKQHS